MEYKKPESTEGTGAFNMAVATLMRIDKILQQLRDLAFAPVSRGGKQEIKVNLVKSFYLVSSPLLKEEIANKYEWILEVKPIQKTKRIQDINGQLITTNEITTFFDYDLELKLDKVISDLQRELQKEGNYLMAGKEDVRYSWKQS